MSFAALLRERAAGVRRRIVFPESTDQRVLGAVAELNRQNIVEPIMVLDPRVPDSHAAVRALGVEILDPSGDTRREQTMDTLFQRRRQLDRDAGRALALLPLYAANAMVSRGEADGCVAGALHTSADVVRAALWTIGRAPGVRTVSSAFYMVWPETRDAGSSVLTFADCAVVRYPDATRLAEIAVAAARDRTRIVGDEPRVAFLSFSTRGSAGGASVEMVRDATAQFRVLAPEIAVDGELQADAALVPEVAARKAPSSGLRGSANVLVFPSLDAGNIAYKLVQRLAHASAIGPIMQGLARPSNDLSRGAAVDDIINVAAMTALQAWLPPAEGEPLLESKT